MTWLTKPVAPEEQARRRQSARAFYSEMEHSAVEIAGADLAAHPDAAVTTTIANAVNILSAEAVVQSRLRAGRLHGDPVLASIEMAAAMGRGLRPLTRQAFATFDTPKAREAFLARLATAFGMAAFDTSAVREGL